MRNLLSKSHLRQLEIFEYLVDYPSISITKLSKFIKVSEKTLRLDIQELNNLIAPSQINASQFSGLSLELSAEASIESIYSLFLFSSTEFLIIEQIFFKKFKTLDHLAESLFISTSTLRRLITTINKHLATIDFQIDSQSLDLIGDENQICNFINYYLEEKYRDSSAIFSKTQIDALSQLLIHISNIGNLPMNYPILERLRMINMIILTRIKNGHHFSYTSKQLNQIPKDIINNPFVQKLFKATFSITLTDNVFYQLFFFFFNKKYCQTFQQLEDLAKQDPATREFVESLIAFLENISADLSIQLKNKNELVVKLYNIDTLHYGDTYILYNKYHTFTQLVTHDYSNLYKFIKKEVSQNLPIKNKNWSKNDINRLFYMLITYWDGLATGIEKKVKVFSVGLFFDTDVKHMNLLKDQLSYFFNNRLTFTIISELTTSDLKANACNFDILLTNLFNIQIENTKTITLPLAIQTSDLKKIDEVYLELLNREQTI